MEVVKLYTRNITIKNLDDAKAIVNLANKYKGLDIKLTKDEYVIDAHSIMGVISMGVLKSEFSGEISLCAKGDITEDFKKEIENFAAKDSQ